MWEAVGQAISYGISSNRALGTSPLFGNIALAVFQIPFTWLIIMAVPKYRGDDRKKPRDPSRDVENKDIVPDDQEHDKGVEAHEMGPTTVATTVVK